MSQPIPDQIIEGLALAHPDWQPTLRAGLEAVMQADPLYLFALAQDNFLPDGGRLFAAISQPLRSVRYVLFGEGPYPRAESATGFCFMDGAVGELWAEAGLSKKVNRATSLRNFMKMLLVADGLVSVSNTSGNALAQIAVEARAGSSQMIRALSDLQDKLHQHGFLLLNATPVYRSHVPPRKESRPWLPFVQIVLEALVDRGNENRQDLPKLILWGKIAETLAAMPIAEQFPKVVSEHPYNLSFIGNSDMQALFGPMRLLYRN